MRLGPLTSMAMELAGTNNCLAFVVKTQEQLSVQTGGGLASKIVPLLLSLQPSSLVY